MMSQNQGPTLAQLNEMDSSIFDDLHNIVTNDHLFRSPPPVSKAITESSPVKSNASVKTSSSSMLNSLTTPTVRPVPQTQLTVKKEEVEQSPECYHQQPFVKQQASPTAALASVENLIKNRVVASAAAPTVNRFTTCTITSPSTTGLNTVAAIKSEPISPSLISQPMFSIFNAAPTSGSVIPQSPQLLNNNTAYYAVPFSTSPPYFVSPNLSTTDKPTLQRLLGSPSEAIKQEIENNMQIARPNDMVGEIVKTSPFEANQRLPLGSKSQTVARPSATISQPRELGSPDSNGSSSNSSINRKWEEIKEYLETEEQRGQHSTEVPVKRVKLEQPGKLVFISLVSEINNTVYGKFGLLLIFSYKCFKSSLVLDNLD